MPGVTLLAHTPTPLLSALVVGSTPCPPFPHHPPPPSHPLPLSASLGDRWQFLTASGRRLPLPGPACFSSSARPAAWSAGALRLESRLPATPRPSLRMFSARACLGPLLPVCSVFAPPLKLTLTPFFPVDTDRATPIWGGVYAPLDVATDGADGDAVAMEAMSQPPGPPGPPGPGGGSSSSSPGADGSADASGGGSGSSSSPSSQEVRCALGCV